MWNKMDKKHTVLLLQYFMLAFSAITLIYFSLNEMHEVHKIKIANIHLSAHSQRKLAAALSEKKQSFWCLP